MGMNLGRAVTKGGIVAGSRDESEARAQALARRQMLMADRFRAVEQENLNRAGWEARHAGPDRNVGKSPTSPATYRERQSKQQGTPNLVTAPSGLVGFNSARGGVGGTLIPLGEPNQPLPTPSGRTKQSMETDYYLPPHLRGPGRGREMTGYTDQNPLDNSAMNAAETDANMAGGGNNAGFGNNAYKASPPGRPRITKASKGTTLDAGAHLGRRLVGGGRVVAGSEGVIEPSNIDITKRKAFPNSDGSYSTLRSASFNIDGVEVLIPMLNPNTGKPMEVEEAIAYYKKTGEHLGKYSSPEAADRAGERMSDSQGDSLPRGRWEAEASKDRQQVRQMDTAIASMSAEYERLRDGGFGQDPQHSQYMTQLRDKITGLALGRNERLMGLAISELARTGDPSYLTEVSASMGVPMQFESTSGGRLAMYRSTVGANGKTTRQKIAEGMPHELAMMLRRNSSAELQELNVKHHNDMRLEGLKIQGALQKAILDGNFGLKKAEIYGSAAAEIRNNRLTVHSTANGNVYQAGGKFYLEVPQKTSVEGGRMVVRDAHLKELTNIGVGLGYSADTVWNSQ
jgi:hypothetical protein